MNGVIYSDFEFVQQLVAQIPWGHNIVLLDKIKDFVERKWYIEQMISNGWSRSMLEMQIDGKVYERQSLADKVSNFPTTLPSIQSDLAIQTMKDPYLFDFISIKGKTKELEIEKAMISRIKDVLVELGKGFAFIGSEYKLEVGYDRFTMTPKRWKDDFNAIGIIPSSGKYSIFIVIFLVVCLVTHVKWGEVRLTLVM